MLKVFREVVLNNLVICFFVDELLNVLCDIDVNGMFILEIILFKFFLEFLVIKSFEGVNCVSFVFR